MTAALIFTAVLLVHGVAIVLVILTQVTSELKLQALDLNDKIETQGADWACGELFPGDLEELEDDLGP